MPDDLAQEIQELCDPASDHAAFRLRRKDMFMGTWLRRAQLYPTWNYDYREQGWVVGPSVLPLLSARATF